MEKIEAINDRLERIETALDLAGIELPEKVAETILSTPTGVFGRWENESIESKLANVIVAPENITKELAGDIGTEKEGKMYFTYDEAMELEKKVLKPNGWRLPTRSEWVMLAEEFGQDRKGVLRKDLLMSRLGLTPTGGFYGGNLYNATTGGCYWSRTATSATNANNLRFYSGLIYPQDYSYKYNGFAVRAVKDIKEEG